MGTATYEFERFCFFTVTLYKVSNNRTDWEQLYLNESAEQKCLS